MQFVKEINSDQTLWMHKNKYFVCSTSLIDAIETMVFKGDENGKITSWNEVYCDMDCRTHGETMTLFKESMQ
jgi:hypothetical protein